MMTSMKWSQWNRSFVLFRQENVEFPFNVAENGNTNELFKMEKDKEGFEDPNLNP